MQEMAQSGATVESAHWIEAYTDILYSFALSRLQDVHAAEDVLQDTLLAGIASQAQFSGRGTIRGWLLGILKNKIVDYIRRRSRRCGTGACVIPIDHTSDYPDAVSFRKGTMTWSLLPSDDIESEELWEAVDESLRCLPPGLAVVFVRSVIEEVDTEFICREFDITPGNLWVRIHRAKARLAEHLRRKWEAEESDI